MIFIGFLRWMMDFVIPDAFYGLFIISMSCYTFAINLSWNNFNENNRSFLEFKIN